MSTLIKLAKSGDKGAFVALMEENKAPLYRAAKAILHSDYDVADAMQDTVLAAWQSIHALKDDVFFKTWLTRILINKCYAIMKKSQRETPSEFLPQEAHTLALDDSIDINNALNRLASPDKLMLTLFYLNDISSKDIAQLLGISESAVRTRLSRSRNKFKEAYLKKEAAI